MKFRSDFVTNSSSSSFIISTDAEIPEDYKSWVKKITPEVIVEIIQQTSEYEWSPIDYDIPDEEIQKLGNFTDEQMFLIRVIHCDQLSRYQTLIKLLEESANPLYYIFVDRDFLYSTEALRKFIESGEILECETDL